MCASCTEFSPEAAYAPIVWHVKLRRTMTSTRITLPRPDDWHVHLRDDAMLKAVAGATAASFARAIVMPNLSPPVTNSQAALTYRQRIVAALPPHVAFTPLMTIYLTDRTDAADLVAGVRDGVVTAAKLYPAGATTNSAAGVTDIFALDGVFASMSEHAVPLLVHGEVVSPEVDIFDREARFIDEVLIPLRRRHPELRIVFEHITTEQAVAYVKSESAALLGATITPHHLCINRNAMLVGGIRPHAYCLPVAKREQHRLALVSAATSGDPHFFLGTDSAPHPRSAKESACGCAGIFNAPNAVETYLAIFDQARALDQFAAFASANGPAFYGLEVNVEQITYVKQVQAVTAWPTDAPDVEVFAPPQPLKWRLESA